LYNTYLINSNCYDYLQNSLKDNNLNKKIKDKTNEMYYSKHTLNNIITDKKKKCYFENCNKNPFFNYQNKIKGI
jgi:hypothetical protein